MSIRARVVHLATVADSLELLLGPQLSAFVNAGYEVVGISAPGEMVGSIEQRGVRHVPLRNATRSMRPGRDLRALAELIGLLRRLRPEIVHTHNPKPGLYGRLAAQLTGVPVVVNTVHGLYAQPTDHWSRRAIVYGAERLAATFSDAELVQNIEDLEVLRQLRVPASRLHLLGNGVDLDRFKREATDAESVSRIRSDLFKARPGDVVFGVVGRLVREKGYLEIFAAARQIRRRFPRARFVAVGPDDPEKSDALSQEVIRRAERDTGMVFLGMRRDVEKLYPGMDAYILASYREGFPRSAMEAAAAGLPIVATNIRGCRQVVDDGSNGLLVPPRDAAELVRAIERLIVDPELRAAMGRASRTKALNEFDQNRQIQLTLQVYESLLRRAGRL